ncbi:forkhead box protein I1c-like [Sinocyclocheilus grahami]|uniref:forkhead box protein I1c-like n=1 Tax=Sinocyclocheilus grahami TaxID=75366 RepID=UPI0007AD277A|nr:PREDICTED: forkhead box protein I1c-like [Sinocyclocheilus grahami]
MFLEGERIMNAFGQQPSSQQTSPLQHHNAQDILDMTVYCDTNFSMYQQNLHHHHHHAQRPPAHPSSYALGEYTSATANPYLWMNSPGITSSPYLSGPNGGSYIQSGFGIDSHSDNISVMDTDFHAEGVAPLLKVQADRGAPGAPHPSPFPSPRCQAPVCEACEQSSLHFKAGPDFRGIRYQSKEEKKEL